MGYYCDRSNEQVYSIDSSDVKLSKHIPEWAVIVLSRSIFPPPSPIIPEERAKESKLPGLQWSHDIGASRETNFRFH